VKAIVTRPGIVSTPPAEVTVAGHQGRLLVLRLEPGWTGGCSDVTGPIVAMPILHQRGSPGGPGVGVGPEQPVRLTLLDVGGGRTLAIAIVAPTDRVSANFDRHLAEAMSIVESFAFVPATP
jgi:hypothetical protein